MKLRCISNICENYTINDVTIGETYEGCEGIQGLYRIVDDAGSQHFLPKDMFEIVDEVAPELDFQIDEFIVLEDFPIIEKKEEVQGMRSLRERVMGRVDYKSIAMAIWDRLEDEIVEELACSFDENEIVEDMISEYRNDYIDVAKEVIIEEFYEDISSSEIEDHIKDIAREKAYE